MGRIGHQPAAIIAAAMPGDLLSALEDSDDGIGGHQGQRTPHGLRGNRVVVEIESEVESLFRVYGHNLLRIEGVNGQFE